MSNGARRSYLNRLRQRYREASRLQRTLILNELCQVCGYNRKYAVRELRRRDSAGEGKAPFHRPRPGRARIYDESLQPHLRYLWQAMECIGAKRMKEALALWLKHYSGVPDGSRTGTASSSSA